LLRAWQGRPLYEAEFAQAVAACRINLNIIDPTNYPAANMRFFELPVAAGFQLSSPCPEMEDEFRHGEELFFYQDETELPSIVRTLLANDGLRARVAAAGRDLVLSRHTYQHRARAILERMLATV
jgi:spore maturation protein CgeB